MLNQVHGTVVRRVRKAGDHDGTLGDALITTEPNLVLGIWHGDCASVTLSGLSADGSCVLGVAHAGWRGLAGDVLGETVRAMQAIGAESFTAEVGPHIGPCCYSFGAGELGSVAQAIGVDVLDITGRTRQGDPALDVAAAVTTSLARFDIAVTSVGTCTGCEAVTYWSHRARCESGRQVTAAWISSGGDRPS